ncbi:MAG TPA: L,D-transpeptidase family protein [Thermoanaerobaculia bacterium]|nr:L,D-transpeptidase family protein [Thermoanaerobaculia bacterium]
MALTLPAIAVLTALLIGWGGAAGDVTHRAGLDAEPTAGRTDLPRPESALAGPTLLRVFRENHAQPSPALAALRDRSLHAEIERALDVFYRARGERVAWIDGKQLAPSGHRLLDRLAAARDQGLDPLDYGPGALETRAAVLASRLGPALRDQLQLELDLGAAFALYLSDLVRGRVDPHRLDLDWHVERRTVDLSALLEELARDTGDALDADARDAVEAVVPSRAEYRRLLAALARYRAIAEHGGWETLADGDYPEPGAPGPADLLRALALRLEAEGDLERTVAERLDARRSDAEWSAAATALVPYAAELEQAVRGFQRRAGLEADGRVGADTLAALRVPVEQRIAQIELGLERWRWLPEPADRRILVDVPAFELTAFDAGEPVLSMRVAVGLPSWKTPSFLGSLSYVELNPDWNVPKGIASVEVLPAALADPAYLRAENMALIHTESGDEVDPAAVGLGDLNLAHYRFRQARGPANPLGRIKFMLPNRFSVYLHDTPGRKVFERFDRAVSHGCVRVSDPLALAGYVFDSRAEQDAELLRRRIASGRPASLSLERPIPVEILYVTARGGEGGEVRFLADVYGHDETLRRALAARIDRARAPIRVAHSTPSTL